eukprot:CAMPEP_0168453078 /NCGR_PEP_ID=MMETSP0228-20121227/49497_1 /TAXON_ID=133427 /ORGANISM="Protoceratium reticulatum, Strain CCCM 535 (=CCMP 1889)" /LENGTH=42 /DNA_ID= /DNA_START= /DNA_END= /DNA_ORIENTATION=
MEGEAFLHFCGCGLKGPGSCCEINKSDTAAVSSSGGGGDSCG